MNILMAIAGTALALVALLAILVLLLATTIPDED
jgi:hypothetical protein